VPELSRNEKSHLVIIGGAEDKSGECEILKRFFSLAGGRKADICVISTASTNPETGAQYRDIFTDFGAANVSLLAIQNREEANQPHYRSSFAEKTGIFLTGGDQLRITGILGGSVLGQAMQESYRQGAVVAGTSAGASAMSTTMLVGGVDEATPSKEIIRMAPGLGLLSDVVVDQHFAQRGRIGRLLAAIAHNPYIQGVGIDEDTAIVISGGSVCEVIGTGTVAILDGRQSRHSNVSESSPHQSLALTDVKLHILCKGYRYDLQKRLVSIPQVKEDI
jgi:cyanophycinase